MAASRVVVDSLEAVDAALLRLAIAAASVFRAADERFASSPSCSPIAAADASPTAFVSFTFSTPASTSAPAVVSWLAADSESSSSLCAVSSMLLSSPMRDSVAAAAAAIASFAILLAFERASRHAASVAAQPSTSSPADLCDAPTFVTPSASWPTASVLSSVACFMRLATSSLLAPQLAHISTSDSERSPYVFAAERVASAAAVPTAPIASDWSLAACTAVPALSARVAS